VIPTIQSVRPKLRYWRDEDSKCFTALYADPDAAGAIGARDDVTCWTAFGLAKTGFDNATDRHPSERRLCATRRCGTMHKFLLAAVFFFGASEVHSSGSANLHN